MAGKRGWTKVFGSQCLGTLSLTLFCMAPGAHAECLSLKAGTLVYDIQTCVQIQPERAFDISKEKYHWIAELDPAGRKAILDSYRGLYLKGQVIKSQVASKGLVQDSAALMGEVVSTYMAPGALQCAALEGKRISAKLVERCCDGTGDAPCLLETSYFLQNVAVIGNKGSNAGDAARQKAKKSKDYQAADKAFGGKDWKAAARSYEKARTNGELDVGGHFKLGYSYRMLDMCPAAIQPLKYIHEQREKGGVWADEEKVARAGEFLLARCYSKMNQPGSAVMILNSYLLEPEKYATELKDSVSHKEFGWIHTSREYRDYEKEARKKIAKLKSPS